MPHNKHKEIDEWFDTLFPVKEYSKGEVRRAEIKKFLHGIHDTAYEAGKREMEDKYSQLLQTIESEIEGELEIQRMVQEKSKEVVAIGRARVAGMVAEKYTRIGKIEALKSILDIIKHKSAIKASVSRRS